MTDTSLYIKQSTGTPLRSSKGANLLPYKREGNTLITLTTFVPYHINNLPCPRQFDLFFRVEKREAELRQMLNIVKRDRKKIQTTINTLEMHKFEAIKQTWNLVNRWKFQTFHYIYAFSYFCSNYWLKNSLLAPIHTLSGFFDILFYSDFGSIFGEMLPGADCRLQLLESQDITKGFEICVNLGGGWNKSLTELSGGQRYKCYN